MSESKPITLKELCESKEFKDSMEAVIACNKAMKTEMKGEDFLEIYYKCNTAARRLREFLEKHPPKDREENDE